MMPEDSSVSPKGESMPCSYKGISEALGTRPRPRATSTSGTRSTWKFPAFRRAKALCPYHAHSAQWEMYLVISGTGQVRHEGGTTEVVPGDAFIFRPTEAHALSNAGEVDFVYYVIADNPVGDCCHYPDSGKVSFRKLDGTRDAHARNRSQVLRRRGIKFLLSVPSATRTAAARTPATRRPPRPRWSAGPRRRRGPSRGPRAGGAPARRRRRAIRWRC